MKMRNRILLISASVLIFLGIANIVAFFSSEDYSTNRFTAKQVPETYVKIAVTENFNPPSSKTDEPFTKDVKISNIGTELCYVRVRLEFSTLIYRKITYLSSDGINYVKADNYTTSLPVNWIYHDGFYYYTNLLQKGASTESLFKKVKVAFSEALSPTEEEFDIFVYAEAVGAVDENGEIITDYIDAW